MHQAALKGSRAVGFTIISISTSLIAVFIPIFFMPGVIGLLFHEFAVVVGLAIAVSAFVSLTLVPMLASRFLSDEILKKPAGGVVKLFESGFNAMLAGYTQAVPMDAATRDALPILLRGACLRFTLTRCYDWINTPADALVTRKDPLAFLRRLDFYSDPHQVEALLAQLP